MRHLLQILGFTLALLAFWVSGMADGWIGSVSTDSPAPPKEIAVTIDDLPLNGPRIDLKRLQLMTGKLVSGIKQHQIPVVGFVNEAQLFVPGETDERIEILKAWAEADIELANHTFSHLRFADVSLTEYQDDVVRGETITRTLMSQKGRKLRYFRHPFLKMGDTRELEESFESFLAARGYRIAPVTIDSMDWMFLSAYLKAKTTGTPKIVQQVSDEYLKFLSVKIDFSERAAGELFQRRIKHILLLHANELNADNFAGLVNTFRTKGYQFITLEQAITDPVYQFPERYKDTSDWLLHWSASKGLPFDTPLPPDSIQKLYAESQSKPVGGRP